MIYDVIIIGGGASGLYAASQLACESKRANTSLSVLVLEKTERLGSKLLLTGSGQCNITHGGDIKDFIGCYGAHGRQIRKLLYAHNNHDVIAHFNLLGVRTFEREDGKVFPESLRAEDVRSALVSSVTEAGFHVSTGRSIVGISLNDGIYHVCAKSTFPGEIPAADDAVMVYKAKNVIVACGGKSYPGTGSDGSIIPVLDNLELEIVPQRPSLVPVHVNDYPYKELSGISFENAELRLEGHKPFIGDLLFTHNSLSGPLIINNSRYIKPGDRIALSYMPGINTSELTKVFKSQAQGSKKNFETFIGETCEALGCRLPKRFAEILAIRAENALNIKLAAQKTSSVPGKAFEQIAGLLTQDTFTINSLGSYNTAMCTKGGVSLSEINLDTMETKKHPHLFIIGETLDVDGDTGGYNLQFAFSSAYAAVRKIINTKIL